MSCSIRKKKGKWERRTCFNTSSRPGEISSRMIHVVILVRPVKFADRPDETWYRVAVIRKIDTPLFGERMT